MTSRKGKSTSSPSSRSKRPANGSKQRGSRITKVALAKVKDDLSRYLRLAVDEDIVITRHGKPAGVLTGLASEDDWFEYRLESDPKFQDRVAEARAAIRRREGTQLEDLEETDAR